MNCIQLKYITINSQSKYVQEESICYQASIFSNELWAASETRLQL